MRKRKKFHKRGQLKSGLEIRVSDNLEELGVDFLYEAEKLPYTLHKKYIPDFIITTSKGNKVYIETKGHFPSEDRSKMLAVIKEHPDLDIRMVFVKDNKITKVSKTTYSTWCDRHNIKYAFGLVPKVWTV